MDRRQSTRVDVELPCTLREVKKKKEEIIGTTANISRTGALIRCKRFGISQLPQEGHILLIDVALPKYQMSMRRCFHGRVTIVRKAECNNGEQLLAVRFDHLQFGLWKSSQVAEVEMSSEFSSMVM